MRESDLAAIGDLSYEVLRELDAVTAIASEWNALLAGSCCNRAFSSAQWFIASCRLHRDAEPYLIAARRKERLVALLPIVLIENGTIAAFPDEESDYNDLIAATDDVPAMTGLLDHALKAGNGYQRLVLSRLRDDSNCLRAAKTLNATGDLSDIYSVDTSCPYIRLLASYDEYLLTRSKSFRISLGQAQRYAEKHNIQLSELEPENFSAAGLCEIFLSLHLNRIGDGSSLAAPMAQAFVREVIPSLFGERRLRAFALYDAESIIAISLCMVGANSLCLWNGGFVDGAGVWSPGKLLISAGIRKAKALSMSEYDFLRGVEEYKSRWATDTRYIGQLEYTIGN